MKRYFKILIPFIITVIIFAVFFNKTSINELKQSITKVSIETLLIFILISISGTVFRTLRYRILLREKVKVSALFFITLVRNFSVDLLPARTASFVLYSYLANKMGVKLTEGGASYIVSMVYDIISLSVLLSSGFIFMRLNGFNFLTIFIVLMFFIGSVAFLFFFDKVIRFSSRYLRVKKINSILVELEAYFREHKSIKEFFTLFALSLAVRSAKYLSLFVIFSSITSIEFSLKSLWLFSFGISATELSSIIPIQGIGGFGTWEIAFKIVFDWLNLRAENSFVVGLTIHSISQIWEYSIGVVAFLILHLKKKF